MHRSRNRWLIVILFLAAFITAAYLLSFDFLVPRTAGFGVPQRWRNIPLRQTRENVHEYLGAPASIRPGSELWNAGTKTKQYQLIVYFPDSIAIGYSIRYRYNSKLVSRSYLLDSNTIR
jgi:hypothetical protein